MKTQILTTKFVSAPGIAPYGTIRHTGLNNREFTDLQSLVQGRRPQLYAKSQAIYREASPCAGLYYVEYGKVKISKFSADGKEQIVRLARSGDVLGLCSLLGESDYTNSAIALDDAVVYLVPRREVVELMQASGQFATAMMYLLTQAIRQADERLLTLAAKPVRERMAEALLLLQSTFGQPGEAPFSIAICRDDLAALVGTVKESVSRLVSEFKEEGIIASKGSKITILQEQKLIDICTFYD